MADDEVSRSQNHLAKEQKLNTITSFIGEGVNRFKSGEYKSVVRHFDNPDMARNLGITLSDDSRNYPIGKMPSTDEVRELTQNVAFNSKFNIRDNELKLATIYSTMVDEKGVKLELPSEVLREVGLIYTEEWVHVLQWINGGTLTGEEDGEMDMVNYLVSQGVELTDNFKRNHKSLSEMVTTKRSRKGVLGRLFHR